MPKMKTNRGAAKRFKRSASGKIRHRQSFRYPRNKRMRQLRPVANIDSRDVRSINRMLPYI